MVHTMVSGSTMYRLPFMLAVRIMASPSWQMTHMAVMTDSEEEVEDSNWNSPRESIAPVSMSMTHRPPWVRSTPYIRPVV